MRIEGVGLAVDPHEAVPDGIRRPGREPSSARSVGVHLPDVEAVVHEHRRVVVQPAGDPEGGHLLAGRRPVEVHERASESGGHVARLAGREVVGPVVLALEPDRVAPPGAAPHVDRHPLPDEGPAPAPRVDRVEVVELLAEHGVLVVGRLVAGQHVPPALGDLGPLRVISAQEEESARRQIPRADVVLAPQLVLAHALPGHGIHIQRMPDLHPGVFLPVFRLVFSVILRFPVPVRRIFGGVVLARLGGDTVLEAEEDGGAVLRPHRRPVLDDPHPGRKLGGLPRIDGERRGRIRVEPAPRERHVRGVLVRLVFERLENGEIGGILAPGQLPVRRLVRVERPDAARLGVVQPHAVADPVRRVERHGKQVPPSCQASPETLPKLIAPPPSRSRTSTSTPAFSLSGDP